MSSDLFDETSYLIKDFKNDNDFRKNMFNICERFIRLGKTIFKAQKYLYFKDTYVIKYPNMKLIETILNSNFTVFNLTLRKNSFQTSNII